MLPILILQTGMIPGRYGITRSFSELFLREGDMDPSRSLILDATKRALPKDISPYGGFIVTGSLAMVTSEHLWSQRLGDFLRRLVLEERPLLAVCYGHQLLAHALGGRVDYHPLGKEQGTHTITLSDEALEHPYLKGLPQSFPANLSHSQAVLEPPSGSKVLGSSQHDPFQIISYGPKALSLQFHPEFNRETMLAFARPNLPDPPNLASLKPRSHKKSSKVNLGLPIVETPEARSILQGFVAGLGASPGASLGGPEGLFPLSGTGR
ncbi:MAG: gamma-glutamyl-gamma-aminobutyrate hydrolase family protein [Deltaproteobacteria bacterium]|jgi:GMP synthase (glutamine-hydrolysing)|nr:gamma-glutamyl-gamma-aminobutyrate hydrolase family protein [Deltaproteobacteria bacterium]